MSGLVTRALAIALLVAASAPSACAHIVGARLGDIYGGALHPMTDPQDLVLWVALGVLAGSRGAARARWLLIMFPAGLVVGLALGIALHISSVGLIGDAAATLVLGILIAAALPLPTTLLCAAGLATGIVRGVVNAGGVAPDTDLLLFATGLGTAGYVAIALVAALAVSFRGAVATPGTNGWRLIAMRACGSWIAAIGLMMGSFALAR